MKLITEDMIDKLLQQADESPRKRSHHNIHESLDALVQKLLVAATRASYFRPHRHADKAEFALVLRGRFAVFEFDDQGNITKQQQIGEGTGINGIELPPATWHTWLVLTDDGVFFETKLGPYDPATASEFAPWAPAENTPEAIEYHGLLHQALV